MLEKDLQKLILDYLEEQPETITMKTLLMNKRGLPDIIVCHRGRFIFIEVKCPDRPIKVTKLQAYRARRLYEAGALGTVTNSFDEFKWWWEQVTKKIRYEVMSPLFTLEE